MKTMIGDCYDCKKEYETAREWYTKATQQPVVTTHDKDEFAQAEAKLKKCGHSWWW